MYQTDPNLPYLSEVSISLLEISCCFASIKCFNYFMLNDCYISSLAYNYAIAGGSLDIISDYDNSIEVADVIAAFQCASLFYIKMSTRTEKQ